MLLHLADLWRRSLRRLISQCHSGNPAGISKQSVSHRWPAISLLQVNDQ